MEKNIKTKWLVIWLLGYPLYELLAEVVRHYLYGSQYLRYERDVIGSASFVMVLIWLVVAYFISKLNDKQ